MTEKHQTARGTMTMNRYEATMPRATFALAALALTALTWGASVVAPAHEEAGWRAGDAVAAVEARAPIEVAIVPARIDVVGEREPRTMFGAVKQFLTRKAQSS